ncbi:MAG TPA: BppU family phage baseplate upper protein [Candidatus Cloacimonas sp.]|nr:BppU family phage baseplate upper protein [Candidatus Cloacimonas sp.]HPS60807.1 BppU family phage baseplate upper protein [Candidatus Cloacimonas sp.]
MFELIAIRGDSFGRKLVIKEDGTATDITDWTIFFTVKKNRNDSDDVALIKKDIGNDEHTDASKGETRIALLPEETIALNGKYYYDIQVKKDDGVIITPIVSTITFQEDVTQRTS